MCVEGSYVSDGCGHIDDWQGSLPHAACVPPFSHDCGTPHERRPHLDTLGLISRSKFMQMIKW